jgi:hypothetical protein
MCSSAGPLAPRKRPSSRRCSAGERDWSTRLLDDRHVVGRRLRLAGLGEVGVDQDHLRDLVAALPQHAADLVRDEAAERVPADQVRAVRLDRLDLLDIPGCQRRHVVERLLDPVEARALQGIERLLLPDRPGQRQQVVSRADRPADAEERPRRRQCQRQALRPDDVGAVLVEMPGDGVQSGQFEQQRMRHPVAEVGRQICQHRRHRQRLQAQRRDGRVLVDRALHFGGHASCQPLLEIISEVAGDELQGIVEVALDELEGRQAAHVVGPVPALKLLDPVVDAVGEVGTPEVRHVLPLPLLEKLRHIGRPVGVAGADLAVGVSVVERDVAVQRERQPRLVGRRAERRAVVVIPDPGSEIAFLLAGIQHREQLVQRHGQHQIVEPQRLRADRHQHSVPVPADRGNRHATTDVAQRGGDAFPHLAESAGDGERPLAAQHRRAPVRQQAGHLGIFDQVQRRQIAFETAVSGGRVAQLERLRELRQQGKPLPHRHRQRPGGMGQPRLGDVREVLGLQGVVTPPRVRSEERPPGDRRDVLNGQTQLGDQRGQPLVRQGAHVPADVERMAVQRHRGALAADVRSRLEHRHNMAKTLQLPGDGQTADSRPYHTNTPHAGTPSWDRNASRHAPRRILPLVVLRTKPCGPTTTRAQASW